MDLVCDLVEYLMSSLSSILLSYFALGYGLNGLKIPLP